MHLRKTQKIYESHQDDCLDIQDILRHNGYDATLNECHQLWSKVSTVFRKAWIELPEDDLELWKFLQPHIDNQ